MAHIIAVANQKGGVAKTTSVLALGSAITELGRRVLVVDLDPQACLTYSLGLDPDVVGTTIHDVLLAREPIGKAITQMDEVDVVPANIDLAGAEAYLLTRTGREFALHAVLDDVRQHYDWILLDCPPSLGVLTINALTAADEVLIPVQCETLSHRGVGQLLESVEDVRRITNRRLRVRGVIATMYDGRTAHAREILEDVGRRYGLAVVGPPVPKSIRFAEAPRSGHSILRFRSGHAGAAAYRAIARELLGLGPGDAGASPDPRPRAAEGGRS